MFLLGSMRSRGPFYRLPALVLGVCALLSFLREGVAEFSWATCHTLGFKGECKVDQDCLCVCFDATANKTFVDSAFFGELGYELLLYTPMVHYYHRQGMLRKTAGTLGSEPFYRFSPDHTEVDIKRHFCVGPYSNPIPHMTKPEFNFEKWTPPPYRQLFNNTLLGTDKPVVIVHNKFMKEWDKPNPVNFLDVKTLLKLFEMLKQEYKIVYIRPDPSQHGLPGYSEDHNVALDFNDHAEIRRVHPEVVIFQDLLRAQRESKGPGQTFNELQMLLHAQSSRLISVQGGNSIFASHFAGTNIIYAIMGSEVDHPETEFMYVYPRLGDDGKGTIVHVRSYEAVLHAARQHFLSPGSISNSNSSSHSSHGSHQHQR